MKYLAIIILWLRTLFYVLIILSIPSCWTLIAYGDNGWRGVGGLWMVLGGLVAGITAINVGEAVVNWAEQVKKETRND